MKTIEKNTKEFGTIKVIEFPDAGELATLPIEECRVLVELAEWGCLHGGGLPTKPDKDEYAWPEVVRRKTAGRISKAVREAAEKMALVVNDDPDRFVAMAKLYGFKAPEGEWTEDDCLQYQLAKKASMSDLA